MNTTNRPLIFDYTYTQLLEILTEWGEPKFRVQQLWKGLYQHLWETPDQFTTLSKDLRQKLNTHFSFKDLTPAQTLHSSDSQTEKILFKLPDDQAIETVLMRYDKRQTLCISTQAGCAMGCVFCATGQMGFRRNLSSGEIVEQVLFYARQLAQQEKSVTNIVFMGMGEPLHNYDATLAAIDTLSHSEGLNLGARRFTISTVGLIPAINRLAQEKRQINLAISLHASDDNIRSSILPVNNKYPIPELISACKNYVKLTGRRITFEWALIQKVNDTPEQAKQLADLLQGLTCHVNVIPLNPTQGYTGEKSNPKRIQSFCRILENHNIPTTIRLRRGIDIQAGCGQLASKT